MNKTLTLLAFDYGRRRIGVAVGQNITASASPVGVISNSDSGPDFDAIDALIKEWRPNQLVVGLPQHADGTASVLHDEVLLFVRTLQERKLPVDTVDERYTSVDAEAMLKQARSAGTRGRISKGDIDSAAAVFIAERYLSSG